MGLTAIFPTLLHCSILHSLDNTTKQSNKYLSFQKLQKTFLINCYMVIDHSFWVFLTGFHIAAIYTTRESLNICLSMSCLWLVELRALTKKEKPWVNFLGKWSGQFVVTSPPNTTRFKCMNHSLSTMMNFEITWLFPAGIAHSNKGSFDLTKQAVLHDEKHTPYVNIKV